MKNEQAMSWLTVVFLLILSIAYFRTAQEAGNYFNMIFAASSISVIIFNIKMALKGRAKDS